jgi:diaminohydroxyphosphoribosylaminopyrimidine deaminase / 5-amino-6-(5-phosphoribosylamino)uracil reductase
MRRALRLAQRGWGQTAPNPMVGAVVVHDGVIVGEGYHARYGGDHAEVAALRAAGDRARGATLFTTLEPCAHMGKTPPCADAVIAAGIARVVVAAEDPSPEARGGLARIQGAGIPTTIGIEDVAARELNAPFFHALSAPRPWVTLKLALSIDGAVADAGRTPGWISNARSRRVVHRLRAGADAVATGIGTVLADDPLLTVRESPRPRVPPLRVVFDRTARLPVASRLASSAADAPVLVLAEAPDASRAERLAAAGVEVAPVRDLEDALRDLRRRGVRALLVEAGPGLTGALLRASVVDRLVIFQSPLILGADAVPAFAFAPTATVSGARRLRVVERRTLGDNMMSTYALD